MGLPRNPALEQMIVDHRHIDVDLQIRFQLFCFCAHNVLLNLQCPTIVQIAGHRASNDCDAHNFRAVGQGNGKLVSRRRLVVPVMLRHKGVGGAKRNWRQGQHIASPSMRAKDRFADGTGLKEGEAQHDGITHALPDRGVDALPAADSADHDGVNRHADHNEKAL